MHNAVDLASKPWLSTDIPPEILLPRGMLGVEERRMLYFLTSSYFTGSGYIVDAGAFVGASAFCLAAGLRASMVNDSSHSNIFSYDLFISDEPYVKRAIESSFSPYCSENYRPIFDYQTHMFNDLIEVRQGDFVTALPPDGPIEILFVDVAKTKELNGRVISEYFTKLIEGRSVLVHQDYYHCWHPEIHITMEYLNDYFSIEDLLIPAGSRLYRLKSVIPSTAIKKAADFDFTYDEQIKLLNQAFDRDVGITKKMLKVVQTLTCIRNGRRSEAIKCAEELSSMNDFKSDSLYAKQLSTVLNQAKI